MSNPVATMKASADEIKGALQAGGHLSLLVAAEDVLRRNMLIAAASFFEFELGKVIDRVFSGQGCSEECMSIIRNKAIARQFFSYFDFSVANTNKLFAAFGVSCKERAASAIRESSDLRDAQQAFLEICSLRNNMVHENFAAFSIDISTEDVYEKFGKGALFLEFFERVIAGEGR